ncbi:MAG: YXWGXW repeat-containing protein [Vulcanimicrobiaceae bacterium]
MARISRFVRIALVAATLCAIPLPSFAAVFVGVGVSVNLAPPPLPVYVQPPVPGPNYLWTPGYWGWGPGGYYWVPGTWVFAPVPGYLWTPGYWGWNTGYYAWHPGYWGPHIGFYGGINYGFGYFGVGYVGGGWFGGAFRYNSAVTNVNTTIVRNVYVDKTVINNYNYNTNVTRVAYNGGPAGIQARPTAAEAAVADEHHVGLTPMQRAHVVTAAHDRNMLATVNGGRPSVLAVDRPFNRANRPAGFTPMTAADRASVRDHLVARGSRGPGAGPDARTYNSNSHQPPNRQNRRNGNWRHGRNPSSP